MLEELVVADPETLEPVPRDGETIGEIMFKGNIVMKGYLKNPKATEDAFAGGWFHSGDLGVMHPDGYIQLKDRSKDIIISGGENISTIEIEKTLYRHPAILEAAVTAMPDEKWGETPCAFVTLKDGAAGDGARDGAGDGAGDGAEEGAGEGEYASAEEIIDFCRERLSHFKCPKAVEFMDIPKTSTGKTQKFVLRAKEFGDSRKRIN